MKTGGKSTVETFAIPTRMRADADERDGGYCRVCGRYLGAQRALHHIMYGFGTGARRVHTLDNLVTVCWMWPGNCHDRVHSDKHRYQPVLLDVINRPGMTALQLIRWAEKGTGT